MDIDREQLREMRQALHDGASLVSAPPAGAPPPTEPGKRSWSDWAHETNAAIRDLRAKRKADVADVNASIETIANRIIDIEAELDDEARATELAKDVRERAMRFAQHEIRKMIGIAIGEALGDEREARIRLEREVSTLRDEIVRLKLERKP